MKRSPLTSHASLPPGRWIKRALLPAAAAATAILTASSPLFAQAPAAAPKPEEGNLFVNGDFEKFTAKPSMWYGVDAAGYLAGEKGNSAVIGITGNLSMMPMPVSVCMVDINGDGLLDLITADPTNYLRAYINSGSKTEPKFTHCEMIPLFFSRYSNILKGYLTPGKEGEAVRRRIAAELGRRLVPRINLYDWNHRGICDLLIGDYGGQVFYFPNSGSATAPDFRQPVNDDDNLVATAPAGMLWGTLFSPIAYDWDKGGRPDLIIGEGSYSANAVHLLFNKAVGMKSDFTQGRYYLAYGDGREQLVPTVADYNGDGEPDLLIADREGKVGAYVNPGGWKPGTELPLYNNLTFGTTTSFGGPITIYAADYNGDGLFDLIVGKNNGRIAVAINKGTKEQPKFDTPVEIKGDAEAGKYVVNIPDSCQLDFGYSKGNMYGYFSVVGPNDDKEAVNPRGGHVLKAAYFSCPNKVFKQPDLSFAGGDKDPGMFWQSDSNVAMNPVNTRNQWTPIHTYMLNLVPKGQLKVGSTYTISFNIKGKGVRDGRWIMGYAVHKEHSAAQVIRGERGSATVKRDYTNELNTDTGGNVSSTPGWTNITKTFTVRFKDSKLRDVTTTTSCAFQISFDLPPFDSVLYIDDVQLVEKS